MLLYSWAYRHLIKYTDPEVAHHVAIGAISLAGRLGLSRGLMRAIFGYDPRSHSNALARQNVGKNKSVFIGNRMVRGKVGLAAGMDKDAQAIEGMCALGFAFVEIGTITPKPQPGNDSPRLWRVNDQRALRNRMGFNNSGLDHAVSELRQLRSTSHGRRCIVGANIGKNKVTSLEDASNDYLLAARGLSAWVDFLVVNVSSPNTPGLRDLQSVEQLRPILQAARQGAEQGCPDRKVPVLIKIAPDLDDKDIVAVCDLTHELDIDGVVATNTTINHDLGEGGLSGAPLFERSLHVIQLVAEHMTDDQLLIGSGGIFTADEAQLMLDRGADLVEALTAFVFCGPSWPGAINRQLNASV